MIIRGLDSDGDWQWGKGKQSYRYGQDAIAENIQTRLLSFLRDCYFAPGDGIDWFRLLGTKNTLQEILLTVRAVILASYGAVRVNIVSPSFDKTTRRLSITYVMDTIFTKQVSQTIQVP